MTEPAAAVVLLSLVPGALDQVSHRRKAMMSKQRLGNALAALVFLIVAIVDFGRDSSGIGVVFLVFAAVFLGLASSDRKHVDRG